MQVLGSAHSLMHWNRCTAMHSLDYFVYFASWDLWSLVLSYIRCPGLWVRIDRPKLGLHYGLVIVLRWHIYGFIFRRIYVLLSNLHRAIPRAEGRIRSQTVYGSSSVTQRIGPFCERNRRITCTCDWIISKWRLLKLRRVIVAISWNLVISYHIWIISGWVDGTIFLSPTRV